jgi:hypothetical protein
MKSLRERICIRAMKNTKDYSGNVDEAEKLVLCLDDEMIPFQTKTEYSTTAKINPSFVVSFECFSNGLHIVDSPVDVTDEEWIAI